MDNGQQEVAVNELIALPVITKREYFAAMALQGILSSMAQHDSIKVNDYGINGERIAELAVVCADELLKQLETK